MVLSEIELGVRVVDGLDAEARAPVQTFARWNSEAVEIRRRVLEDAAHVMGEAFMDRLFTGWPLTHPPMPAPPSDGFTVDRMRAPVAELEPAKPRRRRVRKAKASAPTGDAA